MISGFSSPLSTLLRWAEETPGAPAFLLNGVDYSYHGALLEIRKRAGFLASRGVGQGAKCAVYAEEEDAFVFTMYAVWFLGAVCIPMNMGQKADKLMQMERDINPDFGIWGESYSASTEKPFPMYEAFDEAEAIPGPPVEVAQGDLAMIMFTSGSSGVPKAVPISYRALVANAAGTARRIGVQRSDRLLVNTPPYTTSSIIHLLTMVEHGASTVVDRRFMFGASILDQIAEHGCTGFGGVPIHFSRLLSVLPEAEVPPALRFLVNSGDHLPVPVLKGMLEHLPGVRTYCMYGLTEVAGRLCVLPAEEAQSKIGSVGYPLDGMVLSVRDPKGNELPPGELGEVHVSGPNLMAGYLNNREANEKSATVHGFATGDYGYLDEDGYLYLKGRRDDIFKVGGEKVSVKMIEDAVIGLGIMKECMVVPEHDQHMGMIPCLYYVPGDSPVNLKTMVKELRLVLPANHIPVRFAEVGEIPRTSSGKPIRK